MRGVRGPARAVHITRRACCGAVRLEEVLCDWRRIVPFASGSAFEKPEGRVKSAAPSAPLSRGRLALHADLAEPPI